MNMKRRLKKKGIENPNIFASVWSLPLDGGMF